MMSSAPYLDDASGTIRFEVNIDGAPVRASVNRSALHYCYRPEAQGEDPLQTFTAHLAAIEDAVRRRVAQGSLDPIMLREFDLRV